MSLPAAKLSDLSDRLARQRDGRITFAAHTDEDVREGYSRAFHADVARLIAGMNLLPAYSARSRSYVAFMPWCLHNASLI